MRLRGQYRVVVADPFRGTLHLPRIRVAAQPVEEAGARDSLLILWAGLAGSGLLSGDALYYCSAWGYTPVAVHTWERVGKQEHGLPSLAPVGVTTSELFILAIKGTPDLPLMGLPPHTNSVHVWRAPANPHHKPGGFYRWVEEQAAGPYLSLWSNPIRSHWEYIGHKEEQADG